MSLIKVFLQAQIVLYLFRLYRQFGLNKDSKDDFKMTDFKRYLVAAALPYANGPVHIGHLEGCYIPSDIYVRFLRAQKKDVKFVCGSDEHGVPITIRAMKEGITPQQVVDKYHTINMAGKMIQ